MNRKWRQSTAKRTVSGNAFTQGVIDFDFSIGSNTVFIPSKSYFRIGVRLTDGAGNAPTEAQELAFSNFCAGNLFDNCFFYAGGQNVSSCINYGPQAHALSYRLRKSGAWLNTIGKDAYGIVASHKMRTRLVASDKADEDETEMTPSMDAGDASIRYFMYQPPLGIMEHSKGMGAGSYRFQFNPATNYKKACVESNADKTVGVDYNFEVDSMELYVCEERMDISPTGTDTLHLLEHQVQSKKLDQSGSLDFTIPPSTKAITVFVQSGLAGSDNRFPPNKFTVENGVHKKLTNLQITYANTTKPPTSWLSKVGDHTQGLHQRYLDTQIESGQAFSSGGCESFSDWMLNGAIYHYSFVRDANDRSTQVQLQAQFGGAIEATDNFFIVAHFTRSVQIEVEAGFVSQVTSLNI